MLRIRACLLLLPLIACCVLADLRHIFVKANCSICYEAGMNYANRSCNNRFSKLNFEHNKCLQDLELKKETSNLAVRQNVRTTITDLGVETRLCIRLGEAECKSESTTCVWDTSLKVHGSTNMGACLSARFE